MTENEENLTPEERDKLLKELKKRLEEIEELRRRLEMTTPSEKDEADHPAHYTVASVQEAIEEIVVPPLEMLEDKPDPKKQKKAEGPA